MSSLAMSARRMSGARLRKRECDEMGSIPLGNKVSPVPGTGTKVQRPIDWSV